MRQLLLASVLLLPLQEVVLAKTVRVATFNVQELSFSKLQESDSAGQGNHPQLLAAAEILLLIRPDIVLINEIDYTGPSDADGDAPADKNAAKAFHDRYLNVPRNGKEPLRYDYLFYRATNTGVPSGHDFNNNGKVDDPSDAYGFGRYPGEYGQALFSKYPLDHSSARTFRKLLWKDVPENLMPDGTNGKPHFYGKEATSIFRLSSKSHWDVPVRVGRTTIHLLCSHPTPPVFDGPEDSNGRRNHDEIRLWRDYMTGGTAGNWIRDDRGRTGGLDPQAPFVILGDLNADPVRGDTVVDVRPIDLLLKHSRVADPRPQSAGALLNPYRDEFAEIKPYRTSGFGRLDYVLPSRDLRYVSCGVAWPGENDPGQASAERASDHRLVWVDIQVP